MICSMPWMVNHVFLLWKLLKHNPINPQFTNPDCGGISRTGQSTRNWADCGMNAIAVESVQSWHDRPIHTQSRENRKISVLSAIKPNLTADRQVWAQTGGQAQTRALGSSAILSVPHNPQKELFRIFAILLQSRPRYLQSGRLRLDSGFLATLMQFRWIAHRLDPNRVHSDFTWIAIRGLRLDPWPQTLARGSSAIRGFRKGWSC